MTPQVREVEVVDLCVEFSNILRDHAQDDVDVVCIVRVPGDDEPVVTVNADPDRAEELAQAVEQVARRWRKEFMPGPEHYADRN